MLLSSITQLTPTTLGYTGSIGAVITLGSLSLIRLGSICIQSSTTKSGKTAGIIVITAAVALGIFSALVNGASAGLAVGAVNPIGGIALGVFVGISTISMIFYYTHKNYSKLKSFGHFSD